MRYANSNRSLAKTASAMAKMVEVTQIKCSSVSKLVNSMHRGNQEDKAQ